MGYFHRVFTQIFLRPIIHYPIIIHPGTIVFTSLECAKTLQISDCRGRFFKNFQPRRIEYSNHQFINFVSGITLARFEIIFHKGTEWVLSL